MRFYLLNAAENEVIIYQIKSRFLLEWFPKIVTEASSRGLFYSYCFIVMLILQPTNLIKILTFVDLRQVVGYPKILCMLILFLIIFHEFGTWSMKIE